MKRIVLGLAVVVVLAGLGAAGYFFLKSDDTRSNAEKAYTKAEQLMEKGKYREAMLIASKYSRLPEGTPGTEFNWIDLEIRATKELDAMPRLVHLFGRSMEAFDPYEETVLKIARLFVQFKQEEDFNKLREHWKGKEVDQYEWFLLDADREIVLNRYDQAEEILRSQSFQDDQEIARLVRLALVISRRDLNEAWKYLAKAYQVNPKSTEVRTFRGQILESINQLALARVEYMAALVSKPDNPLLRDQLAEFYRRHKQYYLALNTWVGGLETNSADYIWLKALFWSRTVLPVEREWAETAVPEGQLQPLVKYLINLPEGQYWDEEAFRVLPETRFYLVTRQETFWLRLLQELKSGNEVAALNMLEENPFAVNSWDPDLMNSLRQVLTYRQNRVIPLPAELSNGMPKALHHPAAGDDRMSFDSLEGRRHQLILKLNEIAAQENQAEVMPADLQALLMSEEAIAAVFVANGWLKVATNFHKLPVIPDQFPDWVAFGMTQAFRATDSVEKALEFASAQPGSDYLDILRAEMLLGSDRANEAVPLLKQLVSSEKGVGFRASWILAQHFIEQKEFAQAELAIESSAALNDHQLGKELRARMAVLAGDNAKAESIYRSIEDTSFAARSYLAKLAFDEKDYATAKRLTQAMIKEFPDLLQLRANLKAIIEAEKAAETSEGNGQAPAVLNSSEQ